MYNKYLDQMCILLEQVVNLSIFMCLKPEGAQYELESKCPVCMHSCSTQAPPAHPGDSHTMPPP